MILFEITRYERFVKIPRPQAEAFSHSPSHRYVSNIIIEMAFSNILKDPGSVRGAMFCERAKSH